MDPVSTVHKLHVLLSVHHSLNPNSGAPGVTYAFGRALLQHRHSVEYLSFDDMPRLPQRFAALVFPLFVALKLMRRSGDELDVIDSSTGDTWIWAEMRRWFGRGSRRPILVSRSHGLEHLFHEATVERASREGVQLSWRYRLYQGRYRLWEVARNLRRADIALFLNPTERDYAVAKLSVDPERAHVVPNGIPDSFVEAAIDPLPTDPAEPIGIAQIGAWREMKGTEQSVAALSAILLRRPKETVSLLGTGIPAEEILDLFPAQVRSRVRVVPHYEREKLPELLRGHYLQIFPSLSEGFGLGLLEGMARGLAPVTTSVAGPASLVRDGENGLVVAPGDTSAIIASLESLLDDRDLLERLRVAAHLSSREFGLTQVTEKTVEIYQAALSKRPLLEPA